MEVTKYVMNHREICGDFWRMLLRQSPGCNGQQSEPLAAIQRFVVGRVRCLMPNGKNAGASARGVYKSFTNLLPVTVLKASENPNLYLQTSPVQFIMPMTFHYAILYIICKGFTKRLHQYSVLYYICIYAYMYYSVL